MAGQIGMDQDEWVQKVRLLTTAIGQKLNAIGFLHDGQDDLISFRLAKLAVQGSFLGNQTIHQFLSAEGDDLGKATVEILEELHDWRQMIDSVESEMIRLMNFTN